MCLAKRLFSWRWVQVRSDDRHKFDFKTFQLSNNKLFLKDYPVYRSACTRKDGDNRIPDVVFRNFKLWRISCYHWTTFLELNFCYYNSLWRRLQTFNRAQSTVFWFSNHSTGGGLNFKISCQLMKDCANVICVLNFDKIGNKSIIWSTL